MEKNFSMEWNMEWKKFCSMGNGKIVFHSIACPARSVNSSVGRVVKASASGVVDWVGSRSGQTKDFKIGIHGFLA